MNLASLSSACIKRSSKQKSAIQSKHPGLALLRRTALTSHLPPQSGAVYEHITVISLFMTHIDESCTFHVPLLMHSRFGPVPNESYFTES